MKCFNQREETRRRDHATGLNTLRYKIEKAHNLTLDGTALTVLNVALECDVAVTPWCDCEGAAKDSPPPLSKDSSSSKRSKKHR